MKFLTIMLVLLGVLSSSILMYKVNATGTIVKQNYQMVEEY